MRPGLSAARLTAIIALLAFGVDSWAQNPQGPTRSVNISPTAVRVTFLNQTDSAVDVIWVDHGGAERSYGQIPAGGERPQDTGHGHLWRFKQNGRVIVDYQATQSPIQQFAIGRTAPAPMPSADPGKSINLSPTAVTVRFVNDSNKAVEVFWVDHRGAEQRYGTLASGQARVQDTGHGHLWRFKQGGRVISFYQAKQDAAQTFAITGGSSPHPDPIIDDRELPFAVPSNPHLTADWMGANYAVLKDRPLNRVALPSTHNSGTYALTRYSTGDTFEDLAPDLDSQKLEIAKAIIGLGNSPIVPTIMLSAEGSDIFHNWAKCQERSIRQQLDDGIRSLDLRVCTDKDGRIRICHGEYGPDIETILNDVAAFTQAHPTEIVLVRFQHFYAFGDTSIDNLHSRLHGMILEKLGSRLVPNAFKPDSTLDSIWRSGKRIVVLYDKYSSSDSRFWPGSISSSYEKTRGTWDRNDFRSATEQFVATLPLRNQPTNPSGLSVLTGAASIDHDRSLLYLSIDPTGDYPGKVKTLAAEINPVLMGWIKNDWKTRDFNIIQVDFYNDTGVVNLCKHLNGIPLPVPAGLPNSDLLLYGIRQTGWGNWGSLTSDAARWLATATHDTYHWVDHAAHDVAKWLDDLINGPPVPAPQQGTVAGQTPAGVRQYQIVLWHISNFGSGGDGGGDIELFGSISVVPDGNFHSNPGANQYLFNERAGDRVIIEDGEHYSKTQRKDFYIAESNVRPPGAPREVGPFRITPPGSNVKLVVRLIEHDDFDNDQVFETRTIDLSEIPVGKYSEHEFILRGGEDEKIRIHYAVNRVK
jgi:hypothetical protein